MMIFLTLFKTQNRIPVIRRAAMPVVDVGMLVSGGQREPAQLVNRAGIRAKAGCDDGLIG